MKKISVLNRPQMCDLPSLGLVEVTLTRADLVSENRWRNVEGTINGMQAKTTGGKNLRPEDNIQDGLAPHIASGVDDFRPIDAFSIAINQIILQENEFCEPPEFPQVRDGIFDINS